MIECNQNYKSPNYNERVDGVLPSMIVLHYTGMETAKDALNRLCDKDAEVSAHYTIDEDGTVYQHVDEEKRAWHAGASGWCDIKDVNSRSIGVEIVNPGHEYGYRPFLEGQIQSVIALCQQIQKKYKIQHVLAHSDVAPDRKEDPGEWFPWENMALNGVGVWPSVSDEDLVKSKGMSVATALYDFGYRGVDPKKNLIAFQRHFVPEVFEGGGVGVACHLTRGRLYALLAGHIMPIA